MSAEFVSLSQREDLFALQDALSSQAWPEFMLHDPVPGACWMRLMEAFGEYQLLMLDGEEILTIINTVPLHFDRALKDLPARGVDWGIQKALADFEAGLPPNHLMAVQIVVVSGHRGKGLSRVSVEAIRGLARARGIESILVPLRPSNKHLYPLIPLEQYLEWKNDAGAVFDSWLRVHLELGAEIIGICSESMYIPGTIGEWESWTGLRFPGSGAYIVAGALNPIHIDLEKNLGEYTEPNVWLMHDPAHRPVP